MASSLNPRRIGIPGTRTAAWGEHLCAFFYTKAHLLELIVPYIQAGLEDNEFCLWITGEPLTEEEALQALKQVLPAAPSYVAQKQLAIISYRDWYFSSGVLGFPHAGRRSQRLQRGANDRQSLLAAVRRRLVGISGL